MIAEAVRRELGWSPVREVPAAFAPAVERAEAAMLRRQRTNDRAPLDEAVREWDWICGHAGFEDASLAFRLDALNRCGIVHLERCVLAPNAADDDAALACWRRGLAAAPVDGPERPRFLHNQGSQHLGRYTRTGRIAELDAAIPLLQGALEHPRGEDFLDLYLYTLGQALVSRYQRQGVLADLESAIVHGERSLELADAGAPRRGLITGMVGDWYRIRFQRTHDGSDIDRAISRLEDAVSRAGPTAPARPYRLTNLGSSLLDRYGFAGQRADLDRAVEVQREAVALTARDDPSLAIRLNNLANSLRALHDATGESGVLDEAVYILGTVIEQTAESDPWGPSRLYNLGGALHRRFGISGHVADAEAARVAFRQACVSGLDHSLEWALGAATFWGRWAEDRGQWAEAAEAYGYGLRAIDRLYAVQVLGESQTSWLREARDLVPRAAYVQARNGRFDKAAITLENGRARALNGVLTRQEALREAIPEAERAALQSLIDRIEAWRGEARRLGAAGAPEFPRIAAELRTAHEALATRIAAVRAAFPNFMPEELDFAALAELVRAAGQPLVYLLTTPSGSLALVLAKGQPDQPVSASPIWLHEFTSQDLAAVLASHDEDGGYLQGSVEAEPEDFEIILDDVLPILATRLMGPLATALAALGIRNLRLVPAGTLALLPLHAVVPADFTICYVPSGRALRAASTDTDHALLAPGFLGVGDPEAGEQSQLDFARLEVERIGALFARLGKRSTSIPSAEATRRAIADRLGGATYLHFACHGRFDVAHPRESALYLARQERLTLQGVLDGELDVSALRLVVLSACQTGLIDFVSVPDEVVGFPTAFLQAGVPAVIGTLWRVDDVSTAILLTRFYGHHVVDGMDPGAALRCAQQWLRGASAAELDLAAVYEELYERSGGANEEAFECMTFYRENPDEKPFAHPFFWAAFYCTGA